MFYCRIVHGLLDETKNEKICGIGCPYYKGTDAQGTVQCQYLACKDHDQPALQLWEEVEHNIQKKQDTLFPLCEDLSDTLQKAYAYAASKHYGQVRKGTKVPYFAHLITTMNYMKLLTDQEELLVTALLHDILEDTPVTYEELAAAFGEKIASNVARESENKRSERPAKETWEIRKQETIERLKQEDLDQKMIVLADKAANAESMLKEWYIVGDALWKKFNQQDKEKQKWYYVSCEMALAELQDTQVMKQLHEYLTILFA